MLSVVLTGLVAGLFYAYSCSVNLGLGRLNDVEYLKAMQSINKAILNPWFFTSFFGSLIVLPLASWLVFSQDMGTMAFNFILAAVLIYVVAVFGITVFGNVPLNEALDKVDVTSIPMEEIKNQRLKFELPWNRLNLVRTIASVISFILCVFALAIYHDIM